MDEKGSILSITDIKNKFPFETSINLSPIELQSKIRTYVISEECKLFDKLF
jgi:hypothetical protein